jgi:pyroglutamyl-peptidase
VKPIIVAAFEPFAGRARNRSADAAAHLEGAVIAGRAVAVERLPTVFADLPAALAQLVERDPALLLLVGESAQTRWLLVERLAVNVAHARVRDNAGARPIDEPIDPDGELARGVRFDPRVAANAALAAGVPCDVSAHAGTFCCNAALYHALGLAQARPGPDPPPLVAFVHVPARWPWARDRRAAKGLYAVAAALVGGR